MYRIGYWFVEFDNTSATNNGCIGFVGSEEYIWYLKSMVT